MQVGSLDAEDAGRPGHIPVRLLERFDDALAFCRVADPMKIGRWRGRWESDAPALIRAALDGEGSEVVRRVLPEPGECVLLKHRYSAFDHTALELLLASLEAERVVLVGAATEGCVVQTAIDARERDLKATIVADACATTDAGLEEIALRYAEEVGGIRVWRAG